jgi:hypothetical protein
MSHHERTRPEGPKRPDVGRGTIWAYILDDEPATEPKPSPGSKGQAPAPAA